MTGQFDWFRNNHVENMERMFAAVTATPASYREHFRKTNLRLIEEVDLNDKCRRNCDFGYERAIARIRDFSMTKATRLLWQGLPLVPTV